MCSPQGCRLSCGSSVFLTGSRSDPGRATGRGVDLLPPLSWIHAAGNREEREESRNSEEKSQGRGLKWCSPFGEKCGMFKAPCFSFAWLRALLRGSTE